MDNRDVPVHDVSPMRIATRLSVWLVVVAIGAAAIGVWTAFGRTIAHPKPLPVAKVPVPDAVVWDGRVLQSRAAMAATLARDGRSYVLWARLHPHAAALLAKRRRG